MENLQIVTEEMRECNLKCWKISRGKQLLTDQDDDTMHIETSITRLTDKVRLYDGIINITLSGVNKAKRKGAETYKVRSYTIKAGSAVDAIPVTQIGVPHDDKEKRQMMEEIVKLREQILETKYKEEIQALRREIAAIREEDSDDGLFGMGDILKPYLAQLLAPGAAAAAPGIHGLDENSLVDEWIKLDKEAPALLAAIVRMCRDNRESYNTYKPFIINS